MVLTVNSDYRISLYSINQFILQWYSWGSSVSIVSDYRLDDQRLIPGRNKGIFPLASVSRLALRPIEPPIQWVPGVKRGRGVTLTTQPLQCRCQE
jgi:hypothetical protein